MMFSETLRWLRTKCSRLFRRGKAEAALDAEMQFHLDQLIAQIREDGMTEHDARLAAQREFGKQEVTAKRFANVAATGSWLNSGERCVSPCVPSYEVQALLCSPSSHSRLGSAGTR